MGLETTGIRHSLGAIALVGQLDSLAGTTAQCPFGEGLPNRAFTCESPSMSALSTTPLR